jgi:WD40 repeat protein
MVSVSGSESAEPTSGEPPAGLPVASLERTGSVDFSTEILPILQRNCLACHSRSEPESDVILESPQDMFDADPSLGLVVRGEGQKSSLFRVAARHTEPFMPPEDNEVGAANLSPEELGLLRLWIDQGAEGEVGAGAIQWQALPLSVRPIYALAVAPCGDYVAAGRANSIHVYHVGSKQLAARLSDPSLESLLPGQAADAAHLDLVQSLAFSPDGHRLISGGYRTAKTWKRVSPQAVGQIGRADVPTGAVATQGDWIAVGQADGAIRLFDAQKGALVHTLQGHSAQITGLAFSSDGTKLVSTCQHRTYRVWETESGGSLGSWQTPAVARSVAWINKDGQVATGGEDHVIRVWAIPGETSSDEKTRAQDEPATALGEWKGHTAAVTSLVPVGGDAVTLISAGPDGTIRLWEAASGRQLRQLNHGGPVTAVAVSHEGQRVLSVGQNKVARLWNASSGQQISELRGDHQLRQLAEAAGRHVEIAKRYVAGAKADLDASKKQQAADEAELKKAEEEVKQAEQEFEKKKEAERATGTDEEVLKKAKAERESAERKVDSARERLVRRRVALDAAAKEVSQAEARLAEAEKTLAEKQELLSRRNQKLAESERPFVAAAYLQESGIFATADDGNRLHLVAPQSGSPISVSPLYGEQLVALVSLGSGELAALDKAGELTRWRAKPIWQLERILGADPGLPVPVDRVTAVAFSPDGALLATGGGQPSRSGEIMLWDVETGDHLASIPNPHSDTVLGLSFSPCGKYLASCGADRTMKVFDVTSGELISTFEGHTHHVLGVSWQADGRTLATGGADNVVKVWDLPSGDQKKTITGFGKEVTSVEFLGLDDKFVTSAGNGTVTTKTTGGGGGPTFPGTSGFVYRAHASADGGVVAAGGQQGTLWIWTGNGQPVATFPPP